ncbi:MAG TPA: hypothetical protein DDY37_02585 [Legionella sp.]|nr:hypothetical protein [Legionella sp.]
MRRLNPFIVVFGAGLVLGLCMMWVCKPVVSIAVFDRKAMTQAFIAELSQKTLDPTTVTTLTNRFVDVMKKSLHDYADEHHALILKKECVAQGSGLDISPEVAERVRQHMRGGL